MKIMQLVIKDFSAGTVQAETLNMCTHTSAHKHKCMCMPVYEYVHTYITCVHMDTHTRVHTHAQTCMQTHTAS